MRYGLIFIFFSCLFCLSCEDEAIILFEMEMEVDLDIPAGLNTIEKHIFEIKNVPTRIAQYGALDNVARIHAHDAILSGRFSQIDYGLVNNISIWMISPVNDTLRKEIFYKDFIDFDHRGALPLWSSTPELQEIISENTVDLEIQFIFRTFTPQVLESRINMNFKAYGS